MFKVRFVISLALSFNLVCSSPFSRYSTPPPPPPPPTSSSREMMLLEKRLQKVENETQQIGQLAKDIEKISERVYTIEDELFCNNAKSGYVYLDQTKKCYNYLNGELESTWRMADTRCDEDGGYLASIPDEKTEDFLRRYVVPDLGSYDKDYFFWVGETYWSDTTTSLWNAKAWDIGLSDEDFDVERLPIICMQNAANAL